MATGIRKNQGRNGTVIITGRTHGRKYSKGVLGMDISTKAVWDIVDGTSDLVNVSLKNKYSNGSKMDCILTANKLIRTLAVYMQMMLDADKGVVNYEQGTAIHGDKRRRKRLIT